MKKKTLLVFPVLALGLSLIFAGFAWSAPKSITLKFGTWQPGPPDEVSVGQKFFFDKIAEKTNGVVKIESYWSGGLAPAPGLLDALSTGIADIASLHFGFFPGKAPLHEVTMLPGSSPDIWTLMMAFRELYDRVPALGKELARHNALPFGMCSAAPYQLISKRPIRSLEDIKGLKTRAVGYQAQLWKALGGVPVGIAMPEIYTALDRGTIDAVIMSPLPIGVYGLHETAKHLTWLDLSGSIFLMGIHQGAWDRIPAKEQQVIKDIVPDAISAYYRIYYQEGEAHWLPLLKKAGVQFFELSETDKAALKQVNLSLNNDWVERLEAKGIPGRVTLNAFLELCDKYKPLSPFTKYNPSHEFRRR